MILPFIIDKLQKWLHSLQKIIKHQPTSNFVKYVYLLKYICHCCIYCLIVIFFQQVVWSFFCTIRNIIVACKNKLTIQQHVSPSKYLSKIDLELNKIKQKISNSFVYFNTYSIVV